MTFAQEVAAANSNKGAEAPPPLAANDAANTTSTPEQHFAMPEHGDAHPEQAVEAQTATTLSPQKEGKIRIGTETFDSTEDAMAYAAELQSAIATKDAFELGKQAASKDTEPAPVEVDWTDEMENKLFENPKEVIKKIHEKALADAQKIMEKRDLDAKEASRIEAIKKQTWSSFYESNSDLSSQSAQEVVQGILQRDWKELGPMSSEKALPILAERSRAFIRSLKETQLPTTALPSKGVVTTKSGNPATATTPQKKSSPLDFISQVNKHRKRTEEK